VSTASATGVSINFDTSVRYERPYPPTRPTTNSVLYSSSVSLDAIFNASDGDDGKGASHAFTRRDFRTTNEIDAWLDETSLPADFPSANTTEYRIEVIDDPLGIPTSLFFSPWQSTTPINASRTEILRFTAGVVPSQIEIKIETRHTVDAVIRTATHSLDHNFSTSSAELLGKTNLGVAGANVITGVHTAADTGTYTISIARSAFLSAGIVEVRINGGAFSTVITTNNSSGTVAGVVALDMLEFRHTQTGTGDQTALRVTGPTSGFEGYAILTT